jgi:hypothetical protein
VVNLEEPAKETGFFELIFKMGVAIVYFCFIILTIYLMVVSYLGFIDLVWMNWTGESNSLINTQDDELTLFAIIILFVTIFSMFFISHRYSDYLQKFYSKLFIEEEADTKGLSHSFFRNPVGGVLVFAGLLTIAMIITISCMAFTIGTAFSLGIFDQSKLSHPSKFSILPFFVLGVTIVTLAISEAIKWVDQTLITEDDLPDSENLKHIINEVLIQYLGREEE